MSAKPPPSERSPLLQRIDSAEVSPKTLLARSHRVDSDTSNSENLSDSTEVDERQEPEDEARLAQFEGNAELRKNFKYVIAAVSVGVYLSAADQTMVVASYGRIGSDLDSLNLTNWIATSYFLTLTAFQPLYGKLSDIFGRKSCLMFAYAVFGLGCLLCGLAQDIYQLIAARVIQGIGGGGLTTVTSILLSDIIPLKDRGVWQGLINIVFSFGAGSGAPIGGLLADSIGWRWSFLGQAPLCVVGVVAVWLALHLPKTEQQSIWTKLRRIDFLGATLLSVAVVGIIFGLDRGSNVSWRMPISYGSIAIGFITLALFIYVEINVSKEPIAPGNIIFERSLVACFLCNFFSMAALMASMYYLPLFFQAVDGYSASATAIRFLPFILSSVCGSLFGGLWMRTTGKYYWITILAYAMLTTGNVMILLFTGLIMNNTWFLSIGLVLMGFGNGMGLTTTLIALISNAPVADQAVTTASSYLFRSLGSVVGVSLVSTVVQQVLRQSLKDQLGSGKEAEEIEEAVRKSLDILKDLSPELLAMVRSAYGNAVRHGFALTIALTLGAAVGSLFIKERPLSK